MPGFLQGPNKEEGMTLCARAGLKAILCLSAFCFLCSASTSMQGGRKQEAKWEYNESYGVPVRIALNDLVYYSFEDAKPMRREIFILIDAQYFKPDNLKTLFTGLSSDCYLRRKQSGADKTLRR